MKCVFNDSQRKDFLMGYVQRSIFKVPMLSVARFPGDLPIMLTAITTGNIVMDCLAVYEYTFYCGYPFCTFAVRIYTAFCKFVLVQYPIVMFSNDTYQLVNTKTGLAMHIIYMSTKAKHFCEIICVCRPFSPWM